MDFFKNLLFILSSENPENLMTQALIKANEEELKKASKLGWVIPLGLPYPVYKEFISDNSNTKDDFDEYFTKFYSGDFEKNVKAPLNKYIHHIDISLQKLISEALICYDQELFQICIPALFSVLEGSLVELSNKGDRESIRYRNGLNSSVNNDNLGLPVLNIISISWFLDYTFSKSNFNQSKFEELNRHWSQHGRYLGLMGKSSVLQLFGVVALVLFSYQILHDRSIDSSALNNATY